MAGLRRLDAFVKTRQDLRSKSVAGGIITVIAATTTAVLFVSQICMYVMGNTQHSLHLSKSMSIPLVPLDATSTNSIARSIVERAGKIPLNIYVTFPHLKCTQLDVTHDNAALSTGELGKIHGSHSLSLRQPTRAELQKIQKTPPGDTRPYLQPRNGCTIEGHLRIPIVAGSLAISISKTAWAEATNMLGMGIRFEQAGVDSKAKPPLERFNVSHYIHHIRFGAPFPYAADKPLEDRSHMIENHFGGIALEQVTVKLVPTMHRSFLSEIRTYQMSVVDHTVQPQTLVAHGVPQMPGLGITYDFTPLAVHQTGGRENILVFLSSLLSIVGGVFVTVGLVTGCLVHSAQAVAKKID